LTGRREDEGTAHAFPIKPPEMEIAALSFAFGRLEGRGTRREEREMRREEVFESSKVPSGWEGDGGMRLAGLDARRLAPGLFDN
jgi:hypothetical protein